MRRKRFLFFLCFAAAVSACFPTAGNAGSDFAEGKYFVSVYWAKNSPDRFMDILTRMSPEFRSSYIIALAGGCRLAQWRWIRFEVEAQGVLHWGMQDHLETNGVVIARWMDFPWDHWIDTRIAFGEGLSYAFRKPYLEPRKEPDAGDLLIFAFLYRHDKYCHRMWTRRGTPCGCPESGHPQGVPLRGSPDHYVY
jgi:hypothetical protein